MEHVWENSDACNKGLMRGDIIVSVNGTQVKGSETILEIQNGLSVGDKVSLEVFRQGQYYEIEIALMDASALIDIPILSFSIKPATGGFLFPLFQQYDIMAFCGTISSVNSLYTKRPVSAIMVFTCNGVKWTGCVFMRGCEG